METISPGATDPSVRLAALTSANDGFTGYTLTTSVDGVRRRTRLLPVSAK